MSALSLVFGAAALAGHAMASCAYGTHLAPRAEGQVEVNTFGYSGVIGPTNWVALDPANIACSTGTRQSPIDMVDGSFTLMPASAINLQIADLEEAEFENLGTTVEVVMPAGAGTMQLGATQFNLQQFHFHLPSEHLDNGTSRAMEMHMVWEAAGGEIAVIGVYVDADGQAGAAPPAEAAAPPAEATAAAETAPAEADQAEAATAEAAAAEASAAPAEKRWTGRFNLPRRSSPPTPKFLKRASNPTATPSTLLETVVGSIGAITVPGTVTKTPPLTMSELVSTLTAGEFQAYSGSLTTPPCSEGVNWLVSTQRLQVPPATFNAVRDVIGFNARFPQNTLGQPNVLQTGALSMMQSLSQNQLLQALGGGAGVSAGASGVNGLNVVGGFGGATLIHKE